MILCLISSKLKQVLKGKSENFLIQVQDEVFDKIESLKTNPRPFGYKKLNNFKVPNLKLKPLYRVRVGGYRLVYSIQDNILTITIAKVGDRKEVYE